MELLINYLLVGAAAGVLAGLFGVGGGLVIVPFLAWTLASAGIGESVAMQTALGTSLATIVVTSIGSFRAHAKRNAVLWPVFRDLLPGIVAGAAAGAVFADLVPGARLRQVFGVFELLVALYMFAGRPPQAHRQLPAAPGMWTAGGLIGGLSAILGIGGGTLTVPFLTWCNVTMHRAVGTAAATGLPIAAAGTAAFIVTGLNETGLPAWSSGYVYWPAFAAIAAASFACAPLGAHLAHSLPTHALRRVFALFLAGLGLRMLLA